MSTLNHAPHLISPSLRYSPPAAPSARRSRRSTDASKRRRRRWFGSCVSRPESHPLLCGAVCGKSKFSPVRGAPKGESIFAALVGNVPSSLHRLWCSSRDESTSFLSQTQRRSESVMPVKVKCSNSACPLSPNSVQPASQHLPVPHRCIPESGHVTGGRGQRQQRDADADGHAGHVGRRHFKPQRTGNKKKQREHVVGCRGAKQVVGSLTSLLRVTFAFRARRFPPC